MTRTSFHPVTWLVWLAAVVSLALLTRNLYYLSLLLMVTGIVYLAQEGPSPLARAWRVFLRLGLFVVLFSILANALTVHAGDTVLFRLPRGWPVVGGDITLEAVLFGLGSGLALLALLLIFAVFNRAVSPSALLRLVPGALHQAGVAVTIAVAFVPQMVAQAEAIREAQQARGHRLRGVRDMLPLLVPLLAGGLERSIQLAESLESRGFGSRAHRWQTGQALAARGVVLLGLFGLAVGAFVRAWLPQQQLVGQAALALSTVALLAAFRWLGRQTPRTTYTRWLWRRHDTVVATASGAALAAVLAVWLTARGLLIYYPYPPFSLWPSFQPLLAGVVALLIVPALAAPRPERRPAPAQPAQEVYHGPVQPLAADARRQPVASSVHSIPPHRNGT